MIKGKRYLRQINKNLNKFLEPYEIKAKYGKDFCFYPAWSNHNRKPYITWSLMVADSHDTTFRQYLLEEFNFNYNADIFLIDFLHELGHYMTEEKLSEDDQEYSTLMREMYDEIDELEEKDYFDYYNLKDERLATFWAIKFMLDKTQQVKKLWQELRPMFYNFYKANKLENI